MAKILVADDNSNIQKMVGLALKDQGIDVVAVGNGEAAVRKISDVRPDLVLADVFMPVRNGYEVCNYVKQDSSLSHIPVILLVGAFDPLDEQEAQRVGADGVLKKPFVPPDPLISMVKSALTRAGVVLGTPEPPPPPPPPPPSAAYAKPEEAAMPRTAPPPPPAAVEPAADYGVPAYSSRPPITIEKGEQPLAFGSLLDTATEEEAATYTTAPTGVAPDRDWSQNEEIEEQVEEETSKTGSWRLSQADDDPNEAPAGQTDWREAAFAGIGTGKETGKNYQEWAPSSDKNSLSITEEEAAELAKKQESYATPASVSGKEDWSKAIKEFFPDKLVSAPEPAYAAAAPPVTLTPPSPPPPPVPAAIPEPVVAAPPPPPASAEPAAEATANSWMAGAVSPWEAELQRASDLSSTWDSDKSIPAIPADTAATEAFLDSGLMATAKEHVSEVVEEARESQAIEVEEEEAGTVESLYSPEEHLLDDQAPESAAAVPESPVYGEVAPQAAAPAANGASPATAPNVDELVANVLSKMSPEVLQAVTREILKPVVEALVKDELRKK